MQHIRTPEQISVDFPKSSEYPSGMAATSPDSRAERRPPADYLARQKAIATKRRAVGKEVRDNPVLVQEAITHLDKTLPTAPATVRGIQRKWRRLLKEGGGEAAYRVMTSDSDEFEQLRSSHPFAAVMSKVS